MDVVAHRGLHTRAPENSLAAVVAALEAGLDRIEVDVRALGDGELVLMHDRTLWRTTNAGGDLGRLRSTTLRDVRLSDGSPVPTLDEVMRRVAGQAVLCVDVKEPTLGPAIIELGRSLGTFIELWSEHQEVIACAADYGVFGALISSGLLPRDGIAGLVDEASQLGARALSFYPADVMRSVVGACHEAGLIVMSGTPNDRPTWEYLRRLGVERVITDRPSECCRWLAEVDGAQPSPSTSSTPQTR